MSRLSAMSVLAGFFCAGFAFSPVFAADTSAIPDFAFNNHSGRLEIGDELLPPPSGPGLVTNDPRYLYVLEDLITVDDPGAFTTPWSAVQRFRLEDNRTLAEDVCADNTRTTSIIRSRPSCRQTSPTFDGFDLG